MFIPRPKQQAVLAYTGGYMGVSAVPGSGKTHTLSALAAQLVASGGLADDQEVLIVTLVNSAVDNFARRVDEFVTEVGLLPHVGYRVRTLHGLAHDIVRERPGLVGLANEFQIVDERTAGEILTEAAETWAAGHPEAADAFLRDDLDDRKRDWVRREQWPAVVVSVAQEFIRLAKDLQKTPELIRSELDKRPEPLPLLEMGWAIYADYERGLNYRAAVDYDDLIRLALRALELDGEYLKRLRHRWPFILEDEAQDSSQLQERILRLLAGAPSTSSGRATTPGAEPAEACAGPATSSGHGGNWVRVGDPNQAIFETFTTASPHFLRDFLREPGVQACELPNSGRSTHSIITLANALVDWTRLAHPVRAVREALVAPPHIAPTPDGDPQPNPPDDPEGIKLVARKFTPGEELEAVVGSLARWLPEHPDRTAAVLVPRNDRGFAVVKALKEAGIEAVELLRSSQSTREAAGALGNILAFLADPVSAKKLSVAYAVWRRADRGDADAAPRLEHVVKALRRCAAVEDFLWPRLDREPLAALDLAGADDALLDQVRAFRALACRWQDAVILPIDQLILTIAGDLFDRPADLAVAHKLAVALEQAAAGHPAWRLPELTQELAAIAKNERKFLGLAEADTGFDPDSHKGKVVVATMHKAKGLEWDRVYLMSINAYDFPAALPGDSYISERWFIRDSLNLNAEALAQLRGLFAEDLLAPGGSNRLPAGQATEQARLDYTAERLRLLYVGITRARRELVITWNTGRQPVGDVQPAVPFIALRTWWEERQRG
jgi:DNA helicase-2/ATP-dependent DNA helicase PcrA